jgi:hypothetical protein
VLRQVVASVTQSAICLGLTPMAESVMVATFSPLSSGAAFVAVVQSAHPRNGDNRALTH